MLHFLQQHTLLSQKLLSLFKELLLVDCDLPDLRHIGKCQQGVGLIGRADIEKPGRNRKDPLAEPSKILLKLHASIMMRWDTAAARAWRMAGLFQSPFPRSSRDLG